MPKEKVVSFIDYILVLSNIDDNFFQLNVIYLWIKFPFFRSRRCLPF